MKVLGLEIWAVSYAFFCVERDKTSVVQKNESRKKRRGREACSFFFFLSLILSYTDMSPTFKASPCDRCC